MELNTLTAISPIDGRYRKQTEDLAIYFSEFGLIKYRVWVEVEYFIALTESGLPQLKEIAKSKLHNLRNIYQNFTQDDALTIKEIEKTTNHDVKAVEYFLRKKFIENDFEKYIEFIHFGLTSQDINNTATPALLRDGLTQVALPTLRAVVDELKRMAEEFKAISMLARTHGQPASPTKLGKEILVFAERLTIQLNQLDTIPFSAKFGGATGNFNAHHIAYSTIDWVGFANHFVEHYLKLNRSQYTTQIEHYDNLAALCHALARINTILIDFCRDIWTYISLEYFKQKIKAGEVGSSAMPHKVNPIDFENAEGNLGIANAVLEYLAAKLPVSRLQRDLTDSTVLRNLGVPLGHSLIAYKSILKGLGKLLINPTAIANDLDNNWAVVAEAIQTILRRENYPHPYEALKGLTRKNEAITEHTLQVFITELNVSDKVKEELLQITPHNYTGVY